MAKAPEPEPAYRVLESKVGYRFEKPELLERALTHKSYLNENPAPGRRDNERLEFLGDAVLGLVVGHILMDAFPQLREGELSMARAQLVNERTLARVAESLGLGEWLFLGRGEAQTGGRKKRSILADAFEALVGAIYLDGGIPAAFDVVHRLLGPDLSRVDEPGVTDFKTRLQERAQAARRQTPRYTVLDQKGPDHQKTFEVAVLIGDTEYGRAGGKSKKEAEQRAAKIALDALERQAE